MPVKLFSATFAPGTSAQDTFEVEINTWSESHPDLVTLSMDPNITEQNGLITVFLFVFYAFVPKSQRKLIVDNSPRRIF